MTNFVLSLFILLFSANSYTQSFEGSIDLVQKSLYDTTYFTYYVKDKNIRIDKFDSNQNLIQSMLINIDKEQVYLLSPEKKLYTQLETHKDYQSANDGFIILKTENHRIVNGINCYQWRVKNIERNTEVAYWVSQYDFYFFEDLVKLINRTDKTYDFFEKIPETQGFFPMLTVERTLLRREKSRIYVANITNQKLNDNKFSIPSNFNEVNY